MYNYLLSFLRNKNNYFYKHLYIIQKLFPFIWTNDFTIKKRYFLFILYTLIMILFNITFPLVLRKIILLLPTNSNSLSLQIIIYLLLYGLIWVIAQSSALLRELVLLKAIERSVKLLCEKVAKHIHQLPYHFHVNKKIGETISYIEKTYHAFPYIFWGFLLNIIPTIIEIIIVTTIVCYLYGYLLGSIFILTLSCFIIFSIISTGWISKAQNLNNTHHFQTNAFLVDGLINFSLIKYFGNYNNENQQIKSLLTRREQSTVYVQKLICYMRLIQIFIIGLCIIPVTFIIGKKVISQQLLMSDFILINSYILQFVTPLFFFGYILKDMRKGFTDMESLFLLLEEKPTEEPKYYNILNQPKPTKCTIEFQNVYFSYNKGRDNLKDISFKLSPGKTVALVGYSGSGKSTISNLLFNFYPPDSGKILLNGKNIQNIHSNVLTKLVGIVPQNLNLFNNTIRYNLCYGNFNATSTQINEVLKIVKLTNTINSLPLGLDTIIGETGLTLSSGEKQRIAIARLLLKNPPVYVMDEITSHLDFQTESIVLNSLKEVTKNVTCLVIAHRLSTITTADNIIVLNKGEIIEKGTHTELMQNKSYYFKLWQSQQYGFKNELA